MRTGQTAYASHGGNVVVLVGMEWWTGDRKIRLGESKLGLCETVTYNF